MRHRNSKHHNHITQHRTQNARFKIYARPENDIIVTDAASVLTLLRCLQDQPLPPQVKSEYLLFSLFAL